MLKHTQKIQSGQRLGSCSHTSSLTVTISKSLMAVKAFPLSFLKCRPPTMQGLSGVVAAASECQCWGYALDVVDKCSLLVLLDVARGSTGEWSG